ncbi:serine/threonine protein kinase [Streptosporangium becharense]|uniref:Serine/threonine protein kinase n=1 Tax=Streptosporangium becharense TaxID=1816182 RepID=A0A7W9MJF4_9ACTN|nr:serine/threonine-protein kinase [Streptosporangium becharense]MBB2910242.1 serine/threonine protein kinase [Streptosporangium becharense]MBB5822985.1 serine/threonine protein kinase [Streptosporangium becharense]
MAPGGTGSGNGMPPGVRPLTAGDPAAIGGRPLLGRLGAGGMGVVYLAGHPRGGVAALKTLHPEHLHDAVLRARFAEEVEFSRRVVPFCTAAVVEDGVDGDRPYLVSEYVPGPALSRVVAAWGPLPADLTYGVALGMAAALVAVHEAGLVHRDLKPGNVLLSDTGPRLIDLGIARDVTGVDAHTRAGQVMGSPGWVSPERLTGGLALPASDVFAWGCVVAYAATGRHPFGGGGHDELSRRILLEQPCLASVPAPLRPAVEASVAKNPADRPRAADLLGALLAVGGAGAPRDRREAVAGALARIWVPVPHPPRPGRHRLVPGGPA